MEYINLKQNSNVKNQMPKDLFQPSAPCVPQILKAASKQTAI